MKTELAKIIEAELNSPQFLNETNNEFVERVCLIYMNTMQRQKGYITPCLLNDVFEEIKFEAIEVFRIKTYGHYSLASYRRSRNQLRQCN